MSIFPRTSVGTGLEGLSISKVKKEIDLILEVKASRGGSRGRGTELQSGRLSSSRSKRERTEKGLGKFGFRRKFSCDYGGRKGHGKGT